MHPDREKVFEAILDSIADGVFTVDNEWRITYFNRAAERITGIPMKEALGKRCSDVFCANICQTECALREAMDTGGEIIDKKIDIINAEGQKVPISISASVLHDSENNIVGGVETFRDLSAMEALRKELESKYTFMDIVTKEKGLLDIIKQLPDVAASDASVLIQGPSGSGKELFARAIHNMSKRADKEMVTVNCGAIPETLVESELFGYARGAFTGADKDKPGRIAVADGSTLFLDEVGTLPMSAQVKILRVLQNKTYEPLGTNETRTADIRVISATSADLKNMISNEEFREDLYWRLNVIRLELPPLSGRREDIPLLVEHFIDKFRGKTGKHIEAVSQEALELLMRHEYSGNIRELENAIEHAFVLCRGNIIEPGHLPPEMLESVPESVVTNTGSIEKMEVHAIKDALRKTEGHKSRAAEILGINPSTLWRKMKKYNIKG